MADDDIIRAGAIILKDLALFNQTAVFFEGQVDPVIRNAVGELVQVWIRVMNWKGETDVSDEFEALWICPSNWEEDEDKPFAKFRFGYEDGVDTNSYEIADLFGVGESKFGFRFQPEYSWFGGKSAWNTAAKTMTDQIQKISNTGWIYEEKGVFFLPAVMDSTFLVTAWENEDWSDALSPLTEALNKIAEDMKLFETIIRKAMPKTATAAKSALGKPTLPAALASVPHSKMKGERA